MKTFISEVSLLLVLGISFLLYGCGENSPSLSLLSDSDVFNQQTSTLNNKIDILWVIDNSGSMAPAQTNLASNFNSFINNFSNKGYDFRIGVTTTDAWRGLFPQYGYNPTTLFRLRDGVGATHSGVFVITPSTPNIVNTFNINITQGIAGNGDERAFQSMHAVLNSNVNPDFRRADAYLAVIIVSDEDDFSSTGLSYINENYNHSTIIPISSYINFLDTHTNSSGATRRYSVSAMAVWDQPCKSQSHSEANIAIRYEALVDATGGVKGSLCGNFAAALEEIQNNIIELSSQFFLSREPVPSSIVVTVNGVIIPEDVSNGWTYDSSSNSIIFHGSAIPPQGAQIIVDFDPVTIL